ncbi:MAG TPA: hypothetical protein VLL76_08425 [Candidatus Omnitrophota bacterium]|nr:hypothetical protein [Candidatus Omnitrophota bacterium]
MLTLQDCVDMCGLPPDVVDAIADHEHLPSILAAELGECLCSSPSGRALIHRFILDGIAEAMRRHDGYRLDRMERALDQFRSSHPGSAVMG